MEDKTSNLQKSDTSPSGTESNNEEGVRKRYNAIKNFQILRMHIHLMWRLFEEESITYDELIFQLKQAISQDINSVWWTMDKNELIWYKLENNVWQRANPPISLEKLDRQIFEINKERGVIDDRPRFRKRIPKGKHTQVLTLEEIDQLVIQSLNTALAERREVEKSLEKFLRQVVRDQ